MPATTLTQRPMRATTRVVLMVFCGAILVGAAVLWWRSASAGRPPQYEAPVLVGYLEDEDVDESSGLVASRLNPGLLWTLNSDPDDQSLYCLEADGAKCGVWRLGGAERGDWESLAIGPGPQPGTPYLYLGDIGSNAATRTELIVYRFPEFHVRAAERSSSKDNPLEIPSSIERLLLRYPARTHDAETLLVHPETGDLYVVTKHPSRAFVYKAAAPEDASGVVDLEAIASIRSEQITGGDIAPDGGRVILCTKARGYELDLPPRSGARFDSIWEQELTPVALPPGGHREACAYRLDGNAILMTSEGLPAPLYEVRLTAPR